MTFLRGVRWTWTPVQRWTTGRERVTPTSATSCGSGLFRDRWSLQLTLPQRLKRDSPAPKSQDQARSFLFSFTQQTYTKYLPPPRHRVGLQGQRPKANTVPALKKLTVSGEERAPQLVWRLESGVHLQDCLSRSRLPQGDQGTLILTSAEMSPPWGGEAGGCLAWTQKPASVGVNPAPLPSAGGCWAVPPSSSASASSFAKQASRAVSRLMPPRCPHPSPWSL